jgi:hypothetical protein
MIFIKASTQLVYMPDKNILYLSILVDTSDKYQAYFYKINLFYFIYHRMEFYFIQFPFNLSIKNNQRLPAIPASHH